MLYFSTISWLRLQQETKWVNINFKRRDAISAQKSYPFPHDFGEIFAFNLIKQNVTHFSFIFLTQKIKFKLLMPSPVSFSTSYQQWIIRQRLLISAPASRFHPRLFSFLICRATKQPYSKVDNSRMYQYRNAVFTSDFY